LHLLKTRPSCNDSLFCILSDKKLDNVVVYVPQMLEWVSDCCLTPIQQFFQLYHGENKLIFNWDDDEVHFVQDQHAELDFYSASSLKQ
jgi:hypothetical protein